MGAKEANRAPPLCSSATKIESGRRVRRKSRAGIRPALSSALRWRAPPACQSKGKKKAQHSTAQHGTVNKRVSESSAAGGAAVPLAVAPEQNQRFQCPLRSNSRYTHAPLLLSLHPQPTRSQPSISFTAHHHLFLHHHLLLYRQHHHIRRYCCHRVCIHASRYQS